MALTVEDGSIVANADSYVEVDDIDTYAAGHGLSGWTGTLEVKEAAARYARVWIDDRRWKGTVTDETQELSWPRTNVYDEEGRLIGANVIPKRLKDAQCEMAVNHLAAALNAVKKRGGNVKIEKLGPIMREFQEFASGTTQYPMVEKLLKGLHSSSVPGGVVHSFVRV